MTTQSQSFSPAGNGNSEGASFNLTAPKMPEPIFGEPPQRAASKTKLNLDTVEREGGVREPFEFELGGRDYTLLDPQDIDWQDLMVGMQNPVIFFRYVLPEPDQASFFEQKLPAWKLNVLMRQYQVHYGLPDPGEAAGSPR